MAGEITIDITGVENLARSFAGAKSILDQELMTAMVRSTAAVQLDVQTAMPVWQGQARRSITTTATAQKGTIGTNLVHAIVHGETGRRAGAPMPPKGALLAWMASKGIPEDREFVIRRAISRNGIPASNSFTKSFQANEPLIRAEFQASLRRFVARVWT
jgi:phage gpG-like protein